VIVRNLLRRKTRSFLTLVGLAIGIAAVVALGAMARGMSSYYSLYGGDEVDLLVTQSKAVDAMFSAIDESVGEEIAHFPEVEEVAGMVLTLPSVEGVPYLPVFGYDPDSFAIQHFKVVEGKPLSSRAKGKPLILGKMAAEDLKKGVGDTLKLHGRTFRIVGIYETGKPVEESGAVVPLKEAQALAGKPRQVNAYQIKLQRRRSLTLDQLTERVRRRIERRFPDLSLSTSTDFAKKQEWLSYIQAFTWAISLLALFIGVIGVINTMLMSVLERTREIGTLRALGWRRRRIMGMILSESLTLSLIGGLVGIGLGIGAVEVLNRMPATLGLLSGGLSLTLFLRALAVALISGAIGGIYPAYRASLLVPVEALRYERGGGGITASHFFGGMAVRNLLRRRARSLLTMVGIGVAVMSVVALGAMANGLIKEFTSLATRSGVELVGMEAGASADLSTVDEEVVKRIATLPGVKGAEGFLTGYTTLQDLPFFVVFGYPPRGYGVRDFKIVEGEPLSANRQMIIGRVAADILKKGVGDRITILGRSFHIVGIYETGVPFEDGGGVMGLHDAQVLFGQPRKVSFFGVKLEDPDRADEVRRLIEEKFPEVSFSKASDFAENVVDLQFTRAITQAISLLAIVVGGVGIANTMVMSIFERTREIGTLRALGWRKRRILKIILEESMALGIAAGLMGIASGVAICQALNALPMAAGFIKLSLSPGLFAQALGIALILGAAGGLYPAWRATRMQPAEALRYE